MRGIVIAIAALLLLTACGDDPAPAPEVEVPSWAHVAPEQIAEAKKHGVPVALENDLLRAAETASDPVPLIAAARALLVEANSQPALHPMPRRARGGR